MPPRIKEQILRLDVAVRDALRVEVPNPAQNLLEAALDLARRHAALLDRRVEVAAGAELCVR